MATTIPRTQFWMSVSLVILLLSIGQTSARPSPWLKTIFQRGLDKTEKGDREGAFSDLRRVNTRKVDDVDFSKTLEFFGNMAPVALSRHLTEAFTGALRLCEILR